MELITVKGSLLRCWYLLGILLTAIAGNSSAFAPECRGRRSWSYYNDEDRDDERRRSTRHWLVASSSKEERPSRPPFLTVVIPAYNEEERLPATLNRYQTYLAGADSRWKDAGSQILVVDDGSTDQTVAVVRRFAAESTCCPVSCLSLPQNQGKGAALAAGMAAIVAAANQSQQERGGGLILTADADGSADLSCVEIMYETMLQKLVTATSDNKDYGVSSSRLWNQPALVCGYRVYDENNNNNTLLRRILHWGFGTTVRTLFWRSGGGMGGIRDTQCGCKLLTWAAAPRLYSNLHLQRWSHDVEVLYRATRSSTTNDNTAMLLAQAPVPWRDCAAGSRLAAEGVGRVALRMLWDIWVCRIAYAVGWWRTIVPREATTTAKT